MDINERNLRKLSTRPDPLHFTPRQVDWLLDHIGDLDGAVRDDLVSQLLARGFVAGGFTQEQKQAIAARVTAGNGLFAGIAEPVGDRVFTRTFTALLGQLLLSTDRTEPFLTTAQREIWLTWALRYLQTEQDWRAFVPGHGWAHGIAHGSDLLAAAVAVPTSGEAYAKAALLAVTDVLDRLTTPFEADEEERLAMVVLQAAAAHPEGVRQYLIRTDAARWEAQAAGPDPEPYYRLAAWQRILKTLYFLSNPLRETVTPLIRRYYKASGYPDALEAPS
ncbi:DUF2785 domain-containing protein [Lacticaseibacillus kribbianus]|uniref:DUF2785 domain-containing protein n=1 Tax=Lacticaseibacillus kribbianus TaxID=2926292 RepID=UPI001CD2552A|nr:DUF2785 domain-containing protein [Lacticaseibacillus kribbianus]